MADLIDLLSSIPAPAAGSFASLANSKPRSDAVRLLLSARLEASTDPPYREGKGRPRPDSCQRG
jgi:hypothetical protein